MSKYSKKVFDSDLDAFKNSGDILSASITFSGVLGGGGAWSEQTTITIDDPDFFQVMFDNSIMHPGKFKIMVMEGTSLLNETTSGSQLTIGLWVQISGNNVTLGGSLQNPYSGAVNLQTTTLNFRLIPYEGTI